MSARRSTQHAGPDRGSTRSRLFLIAGAIAVVAVVVALVSNPSPGSNAQAGDRRPPSVGAGSPTSRVVGGRRAAHRRRRARARLRRPPRPRRLAASSRSRSFPWPTTDRPRPRSRSATSRRSWLAPVLDGRRWSSSPTNRSRSSMSSRCPSGGSRIVTAPSATVLMTDLAAHRDRLGFLRADEVGPGVRALGWGRSQLFGVHRLKTVSAWPLTARLPAPAPSPYDPATTWTLFAAGDLGLDRTYANVVKIQGKGIDYPFNGGRRGSPVSSAARRSAGRSRPSSRPAIPARCAT